MKEYIWFWTDKIKHTCYIEIIQDQYAIIIDNFIYRLNRLLCALGKGGGLSQILYYISWNWWDKFFLKKLSTGTRYWLLNTHRNELNFTLLLTCLWHLRCSFLMHWSSTDLLFIHVFCYKISDWFFDPYLFCYSGPDWRQWCG